MLHCIWYSCHSYLLFDVQKIDMYSLEHFRETGKVGQDICLEINRGRKSVSATEGVKALGCGTFPYMCLLCQGPKDSSQVFLQHFYGFVLRKPTCIFHFLWTFQQLLDLPPPD